jgi:2-polyprenyl-3-methyl-5-hydroxy-6-metoxy-1,4-benzoquinol methylase
VSSAKSREREALDRFVLKVWQYKQGEVVSLMVHLGDRLGLYRAMDSAGWLSPAELASRTCLQERWVREWLRGQAAAGLVDADQDAGSFALSPEGALVLAREDDSLVFAAGAFAGGIASAEVVDALAEAFRTGIGLTFDQSGEVTAHRVSRISRPWARLALVPEVVPAIADLEDRLKDGIRVLDIGCGAGIPLLTLAEAFPKSRFEGLDPSHHAIDLASRSATDSGLPNVTFRVGRGEELPTDPVHDLILTFDCLHDMTHPQQVASAIRGAIRSDGTWLIREIRSSGSWSDDLRSPVLAMMYGLSVASCMSSALSEPDGAGLGTLGLPPRRVEELCRAAGFREVVFHDLEEPSNLYYEVRP